MEPSAKGEPVPSGSVVEHLHPVQIEAPDAGASVPPKSNVADNSVMPWMGTVLRIGAWFFGALLVVIAINEHRSKNPDSLDSLQKIVEEHYMRTPSTAKWLERKVIKHEGRWWQAYFRVDAQNQFGAMIRSNLCVVAAIDPDGTIRWDRMMFVWDECALDQPEYLEGHRRANNWGAAMSPQTSPTPPGADSPRPPG